MPDGPDVKVVDLDGLEAPLDVFEVLVDPADARRVRRFRDSGGPDHVDPVEPRLGGDVVFIAAEGEAGIADFPEEVLAGLVLADDLPDPYPELFFIFQPATCHRRAAFPHGRLVDASQAC